MDNLRERLLVIIKNQMDETVDVQKINDDDYLSDYGLDSTGILKLIISLEDEFDFEIKDEDFDNENFETISSLLDLIKRKMEE